MFLPLLFPGQYLIFSLIVYSFVSGLELSYIDKEGDAEGTPSANSL